MSAAWAAKHLGVELRVAPFELKDGKVDAQPFIERIDGNTALVSLMYANNETGVLHPLETVFAAAKAHGSLCHTDGVQAMGKMSIDLKAIGADLFSFSGHKIHGPRGVGGVFIRRGIKIESLIHGGPQEGFRRAGTENVAAIVGLGKAAQMAANSKPDEVRAVRDHFEKTVAELFGNGISINFPIAQRTPNVSSLRFKNQDGNLLMIKLDRMGICVSTGAACNSGALSPSKTLLAMGLSEQQATSTLRFSFSKNNTRDDVDTAVKALRDILRPRRTSKKVLTKAAC